MLGQQGTPSGAVSVKIDGKTAAEMKGNLPKGVSIVFDGEGNAFLVGPAAQVNALIAQMKSESSEDAQEKTQEKGEDTSENSDGESHSQTQSQHGNSQQFVVQSLVESQEIRFGAFNQPLSQSASPFESVLKATSFTFLANPVTAPIFIPVSSGPQTISLSEDSVFSINPIAWFSGAVIGSSITFSLDGSSLPAWMTYNAGTSLLTGTPDNGDVGSYVLRATYTNGTNISEAVYNVVVQNVNDAPSVPTDTNIAANTVAENVANGTLVGITAHATDVDAGATLVYSLTDSAGGRFSVNSSTGVVSVANGSLLNYEGSASHNITVRVSDGVTFADQLFTISVTDVNDAPVASNATYSVIENSSIGTVLGTATAIDQDAGDTRTWSIVSGNTGGMFAISSGGQITLAGSPNFEGTPSYSLVVRATDAGGLTSDATITVNVSNVNEAPTASNATFSVAENSSIGTVVGTTSATDPDAGDTRTWSIVSGNTGGMFAISSGGQITLAGSPNFEGTPSYSLVVRATDAGGLTSDATITVNVSNVNEAPTASNATFSVAENSSIGTVVGTTSATDPDAGDTRTWSIVSGNTGGMFAISSGGQITLAGSPNFEGTPSYSLVVRATDAGGLTSDATITVNVSNVNEAPTASDNSYTVPENFGTGSVVTNFSATDPDAGDTATWSIISGNTGGLFSLTGAGQLSLTGSPGAVGTNYSLVVRVTDAGGLTSDATITVNVTNVNEAPTANNATYSVAENSSIGSVLGTVTASDPDAGDTHTWSIVSGNTGGMFAISSGGQITLAGSPNFEGTPSYSLVVRATDAGGLTSDATITVNVTNVNEAPTANNATYSVAENSSIGSVLGTVTASDPDAGDTHTWSIVSGNTGGMFAISSGGQITLAGSPNFEGTPSYSLVVRATDAGGLTSDATITVNVSNVNEAPTALNATFSVAENSSIGTVVGTTSATDPDAGDTRTWSIVSGNTGGMFAISSGGQITLAGSPNFEGTPSYSLVVRATDAGGLTSDATITVNVSNVNEAPTASNATFSVAENSSIGTVVGTTSATDPDAGDTRTWSIVSGNTGGMFAISSGGQITLAGSPNFEGTPSYSLVVRATDAGGLTSDATITVNVTNVNEAPTANNATYSVAENSSIGSVLGTVTASDPDAGDTHTWSIVSGNTGGMFAISSGGQITLAGSPNFEGTPSYSLVVRATDAGGLTSDATITVNVSNVNEAPTALNATFSVAENSSIGTVVGTTSATDPDAGDTRTWSIVSGNTGGMFAISSGGQITLAGSPNFEGTPSYSLVVRAMDAGGLTSDATITVNVSNVNEAPTASNATFSVAENSSIGTVVGTTSATDPDAGDTRTWSIVSGNTGGMFAISSGGQITLAGSPNFEGTPSYSLVVRAMDAGGLTSDATITVNVSNVNEAPNTNNEGFGVASSASAGFIIGDLDSTDPDSSDVHTWSIVSGNGSGVFSLDTSGQLSLTGSPGSAGTVYSLVVRVTDAGGLTDDATITVTVDPSNQAPTAQNDTFTIAENSSIGTAVGDATATDPDVGDTQSWSIVSGNTGGMFAISSGGQITLADSPDFEAAGSYSLVVRVSDSGSLTSDATITVNVTNVNEAPDANDDSISVIQNSAGGTVVGTMSGTDPDSGDTLTWTLISGDTNGLFSLAANGNLSVTQMPSNFPETSYSLVVRATDAGGLTSDAVISVTINASNTAPDIIVGTFGSMYANASSPVRGVTFSDPDMGQSMTVTISSLNGTYTINTGVSGGVGAGNITGNGTANITITGVSVTQLNNTFAANGVIWDMVTPNSLDHITLTVSDGIDTDTLDTDFLVHATNLSPTVDEGIAGDSITAGDSWSYTFSTGAFADTSGDVITYTATLDNNSPLPALITFDAGTRTFTTGATSETDVGIYSIKVTATDQGGLTATHTFQFEIESASGGGSITGDGDDNTLNGTNGNDTIFGLAGNDTIDGGGGDDNIYGDIGSDTLTGGLGLDRFTFETATAFTGVDTVTDFSISDGDKINLTDILDSFDMLQDSIDDFVSLSVNSGNTTLSVDRDGTGSTYTMQAVVIINNMTWSSVTDMATEGSLLADSFSSS